MSDFMLICVQVVIVLAVLASVLLVGLQIGIMLG